jgi:prevent-host-death family protein
MAHATITEVKNGLSAIIDRVKAGEAIVVTDRGIPVAVIEPVHGRVDVADRLSRLERNGLLRRASAPPPLALMGDPGPTVEGDTSAVDLVLEERRSGR